MASEILYILWVSEVLQTCLGKREMSLLGIARQGYHFTSDITLFPRRKLLLSIWGGPGNRHHLACRRSHLGERLEGGSRETLAGVGRRIGVGHRIEVGHRTIGDPFHDGRRLRGKRWTQHVGWDDDAV